MKERCKQSAIVNERKENARLMVNLIEMARDEINECAKLLTSFICFLEGVSHDNVNATKGIQLALHVHFSASDFLTAYKIFFPKREVH